jgi:hypothetical protein
MVYAVASIVLSRGAATAGATVRPNSYPQSGPGVTRTPEWRHS